MDIPQILLHLGLISLTSLAIMYACDTFETASRWLGGHFPQGIRGATINAIGSSLPELFTTFFLLFVYHNQDGFSAGIATCAGSAIFNAVVIPGLCILAVLFWGVHINGKHESVEHISVKRSVFLRDASFFLLSCGLLVVLLSNAQLGWKHGAILVGMYFLYIGYIVWEYRTNRTSTDDEDEDEDDEDDEDEDEPANLFVALLTLQFQWILYKDKPLNRQRAWVLLGIGVVAIAVPCHILATSCVALAKHLHVHPFYTAVIFAAAATSVPDTIISIRDARQGDYDDAISNAFGSNIFDINIALGLPLMLYGLIYGPVKLTGIMTPAGKSVAAVQELQLLLLLISVLILLLFLVGKSLGKVKAVLLFSLYGVFIGYCVGRAYNASWLEPIAKMLQFTF